MLFHCNTEGTDSYRYDLSTHGSVRRSRKWLGVSVEHRPVRLTGEHTRCLIKSWMPEITRAVVERQRLQRWNNYFHNLEPAATGLVCGQVNGERIEARKRHPLD